jgi:hypothetical protein
LKVKLKFDENLPTEAAALFVAAGCGAHKNRRAPLQGVSGARLPRLDSLPQPLAIPRHHLMNSIS